jgi:superfamily II DNA or RNA helicase
MNKVIMAVNITNPEFKETKSRRLPSVSLDTLKQLRIDTCMQSSKEFKLQGYQRFLRRVLSPDSPVRNLLVTHGTGTGKTCTAIQIAEEYIIRPEFQEKTVLILAQPSVQNNFKNQIFDITKVSVDNNIVLSQQCTGRRYLDMILRVQNEPMKWTDPVTRERIVDLSQKLIQEFYEFQGYIEFANKLEEHAQIGGLHLDAWIHKNFDNRMIIVDEAHNLRSTDEVRTKKISIAIEEIIKTANNVTLILLTATPMFDDFTEILYYFNLFLWNDRKHKKDIQVSKIFNTDGTFKENMEQQFRKWCQEYVSYVKGDNPLSFPFRLPPPKQNISVPATIDIYGQPIPEDERRKYLDLVGSSVEGYQAEVLTSPDLQKIGLASQQQTLCVFPNNLPFKKTFVLSTLSDVGLYKYAKNVPPFLSPSKVGSYSSKFKLITEIIKDSTGIIFVFSNFVDYGAQLFAMCLEEHGYTSATGSNLLEKTSEEIKRGSQGKYALFTSTNTTSTEQTRLLERLRLPANADGSDIKIIIGSKTISEGIDLKYIRQIHILDFSWNMSSIEQAVGRGIRTCSHSILPFEDQNCTVYLHICKIPGSQQELVDEYYYRTKVEIKGKVISKIKTFIKESSMDCELQNELNSLPTEWKTFHIKQRRSYKDQEVKLKLEDMASPLFDEPETKCKPVEVSEEEHDRPLSAYFDVRDEILDIIVKLFVDKPIWKRGDLLNSPELKKYEDDVIIYILQNAIESGFQIKDKVGRTGKIESKGDLYAFTTGKFKSLQERYITTNQPKSIKLKKYEEEKEAPKTLEELYKKLKIHPSMKERFARPILDWYIMDHVMTDAERTKYLLELDWDNAPEYIQRLQTKTLKILGSEQIYSSDEKIVPYGEQKDEYDEWVEQRKEYFLDNKSKFFAAMDKGKIKFNIDENAKVLKKVDRSKGVGGRACGSYPENILNLFAEWLNEPFPDYIKTITDRCQFLALLVRESIGEKIIWITPEEWSIFNEPENRKELLSKSKI